MKINYKSAIQTNGYSSVCAKRNIVYAAGVTSLGDSPHHLQLVATSFICATSGNDVLAALEMMLTFGPMMLCLSAQMKKSNSYELDFLCLVTVLDDIAKT